MRASEGKRASVPLPLLPNEPVFPSPSSHLKNPSRRLLLPPTATASPLPSRPPRVRRRASRRRWRRLEAGERPMRGRLDRGVGAADAAAAAREEQRRRHRPMKRREERWWRR
uniref:Uncharacterized protein n=2 Tax=Aegilops tauschii subsp. strangulata TaxID=200361 RepID=A0A452Y4E5_AEGTS